ncbi:hypothetical protein FDECE_2100 [Fusarium decemcellulare]|nr:hypothetical protein FDECE_2100 [Fusarium decemcellulare]
MHFSTKSLIVLAAGASARNVRDPEVAAHLFGRQMAAGCGVECPEDLGYFQCANFKSGGCLKAIEEAQCTTPAITDAEAPPQERWNSVYTGEFWENVTIWYANEREHAQLPFARWISNKVNGKDNMDCQNLVDRNGCAVTYLCDDVKFPAGFLVLNSFITLNNLLWNFYDSMYKAKSDLESAMSTVSSTFAPMESGMSTAVIIDLATLGFVTAAAPIWNMVTRTLPAMKSPRLEGADANGLIKDTVNGLVTQGLTLTKDLTRTEAKLAAENDLNTRMGAVVEIWANSASNFASQIFSGDSVQVNRLGALIKDGKLAATPFGGNDQGTPSAEEMKQLTKKALFADLIPRAWRLSNLPLGPFILKSNKNCGGEVVWNLSNESRDKYGICINGEMFILTSAPDPGKNCGYSGDTSSCLEDFFDLPGADTLDGSAWGGLTVEDIVRGSVATWDMHGHQNKGKISMEDPGIIEQMNAILDPMVESPADTIFDQLRENGILTPGIFDIPVCDYKEAIGNWEIGFKTPTGWKPGMNYPCND